MIDLCAGSVHLLLYIDYFEVGVENYSDHLSMNTTFKMGFPSKTVNNVIISSNVITQIYLRNEYLKINRHYKQLCKGRRRYFEDWYNSLKG